MGLKQATRESTNERRARVRWVRRLRRYQRRLKLLMQVEDLSLTPLGQQYQQALAACITVDLSVDELRGLDERLRVIYCRVLRAWYPRIRAAGGPAELADFWRSPKAFRPLRVVRVRKPGRKELPLWSDLLTTETVLTQLSLLVDDA